MIEANMPEAKTKLSQLVDAPERGEHVFLKRNGVLVARIIAVPKLEMPFGFLKKPEGSVADELLFGMSEEELREFTKL